MGQTRLMGRIEKLEQEIESLSSEELSEFRAWFAAFDWGRWDAEFESDVAAGRLDALADDAIREHEAGRTKPI